MQKLKTTQVQNFCEVFSSEGQLGLGGPKFSDCKAALCTSHLLWKEIFILWKVTSSVRPLDTGINQNVGVTLVAIWINALILALTTTFFFKGPKPSFFCLGYLFSSILFNYIATDASILHLKSGSSSRSTYFSTSNPSKHTPFTIADFLQVVETERDFDIQFVLA